MSQATPSQYSPNGGYAIIRTACGTRQDPKGEGNSSQPYYAIPRQYVQGFRWEAYLGPEINVLGQIRLVEHLDLEKTLTLSGCLEKTRAQQAALPVEYGLTAQDEAEILATLPTLTCPGAEIDLYPADLKHTLEGRAELLRVTELLREDFARREVVPRLSLSASCEDPDCWDPNGPDCPHGASGLHTEHDAADETLRRPDLSLVVQRDVIAMAKRLGLAWGRGAPEHAAEGETPYTAEGEKRKRRYQYRGAYVDTSTLGTDPATRGSLLRALGAPHKSHGPKKRIAPFGPVTPFSRWWLEDALEERDLELAAKRARAAQIAALPKREPRPPLLTPTSRSCSAFPASTAVLAEHRGAMDPQLLTVCLSTILLRLGLSVEQGTDLVQAGLQRSERRTVSHAFEDTARKLAVGEKKLAGKGRLVRENLYLFLVRLSQALALDLEKPFARVYQEVAKVFEPAGSTRVQCRAEVVAEVLGGSHRYATLFANLMTCGQAHHEICPTNGTLGIRFCTCKVLFCDYCKPYSTIRTAHRVAELWAAFKDKQTKQPIQISIAETEEYPSRQAAARERKATTPPIGVRWVLGCRGADRWYYLLLVRGPRSRDLVTHALPRAKKRWLDVSPEQAADLVAGTMLTVHAAAQDLFMKDVKAWEAFMDQVHGAHLTAAQRSTQGLPWPKKGERLEAGEDHGEGEKDCNEHCRAWHEHRIVDPSGVEIMTVVGHPPTNKSRIMFSRMKGVGTPSGRARAARAAEQDAAAGRVGAKRPYRKARRRTSWSPT